MAKKLSQKDLERIKAKREQAGQAGPGSTIETSVQKASPSQAQQHNPITEAQWGRNWMHMVFGFGVGTLEGVVMRASGHMPQWHETLCSAVFYGGVWGYLSKPYFELLNEKSIERRGKPTKIQVADRFDTNYFEVAPGSMAGIGAGIYAGYYAADLVMRLL